jgi:hypothetical protein
MGRKFTTEDLIKLFEHLIESNDSITSSNHFRKHLDRDEKLFANQVTKKANSNIAYRQVDCNVMELSDDEFWAVVDKGSYNDLIEENAASDIVKMAKKFNLLS